MAKKHASKKAAQPIVPVTAASPVTSAIKPVKAVGIALFVISFALFANTLTNGFVLDDYNVINDNTIVTRGISAIPELLSTSYRWGYVASANDNYRPLSLTMFAAEYQFFGLNPLVFHLINVLLYALTVVLLFRFLVRLLRGRLLVPLIAALLFAAHPLHTEVVANIKSRDELLCTFFGILALGSLLDYYDTGRIWQLIVGGVCYFLSLLSKETTITFLGVIPLMLYYYDRPLKPRVWAVIAASLVPAGIYLALRSSILNAHGLNDTNQLTVIDNMLIAAPTAAARIATAMLIMGTYLKLLLIPYPLICDYSYNSIPLVTFSDPRAILSMIAYLAIAGFCVRQMVGRRDLSLAFPLLFFLITVSLFSNIPFLVGTPMAERFLFLPSVGFCLLAAQLASKYLLRSLPDDLSTLRSPKVWMVFAPVLLLYGGLTLARNADWHDELTLYKADVEKSPVNARLYYYLSSAVKHQLPSETDKAVRRKLEDDRIGYLRQAITILPDYLYANNSLASAYIARGKWNEALPYVRHALVVSPGYRQAIANLAYIYLQQNKLDSAIATCRTVLAAEPGFLDARLVLATAFFMQRQYDSAAVHYKAALVLQPDNLDAINNLGSVYLNTNQWNDAIAQSQKAISLSPGSTMAFANMGKAYYSMQQYQPAANAFRKELSFNPATADVALLARCYAQLARPDSAALYMQLALRVDPGFKM